MKWGKKSEVQVYVFSHAFFPVNKYRVLNILRLLWIISYIFFFEKIIWNSLHDAPYSKFYYKLYRYCNSNVYDSFAQCQNLKICEFQRVRRVHNIICNSNWNRFTSYSSFFNIKILSFKLKLFSCHVIKNLRLRLYYEKRPKTRY